jgi:HPt (histidine-containing phosphotransfer) domain-containing protein
MSVQDIPRHHDPAQQEALNDFFEDFNDAYPLCETTLLELEHAPDDQALLNSLFRVVHTIKGNLGFIGLMSAVPLLQSLEDVLDDIRKGHMAYNSLLCDVILLTLDKTRLHVIAEASGHASPLSEQSMQVISQHLTQLTSATATELSHYIHKVLQELDPDRQFDNLDDELLSEIDPPMAATAANAPQETCVQETAAQASVVAQQATEQVASNTAISDAEYEQRLSRILKHYGIPVDEDIGFLLAMAPVLERKTPLWRERLARQMFLCLEMNRQGGYVIAAEQLAVAVVMHDMALSFYPETTEILTEPERRHPLLSAGLLGCNSRFEQAAEMILQHHERYDGWGVPKGLSGEQIGSGAMVLAIADKFDAIMHDRYAPDDGKKPIVRAMIEINQLSGKAFTPEWVEVFTQVVKKNHQHLA